MNTAISILRISKKTLKIAVEVAAFVVEHQFAKSRKIPMKQIIISTAIIFCSVTAACAQQFGIRAGAE
jgi:hypothetical protein